MDEKKATLMVAVVVAAVVAAVCQADADSNVFSSFTSVKEICQLIEYRDTCEITLSAVAGNSTNPKDLITASLGAATTHLRATATKFSFLQTTNIHPQTSDALRNCRELLRLSINDLDRSLDKLNGYDLLDVSEVNEYISDVMTWLSGSITFQDTCLDGFKNSAGDSSERMNPRLKISKEHTSNALSMVAHLAAAGEGRLFSGEVATSGFPALVSGSRQRLSGASLMFRPNVVVALDGSGKYKTISEALKEVPATGKIPFVIYVKAGIYNEYVSITNQMPNVVLFGDGPTRTKITGNRSPQNGYSTWTSCTVCVDGDRFVAMDIGFENSAGPSAGQAVALRLSADQAALYKCQIDGYQDTLFAVAYRQFYRECTITGDADFIFGNAAVVFQNCNIVVRKPAGSFGYCIIAAQGRDKQLDPTGTIFQNCTITATQEYKAAQSNFTSYLGRPWRPYSRTIVMYSYIDNIIDPAGWQKWAGQSENTCFYAEYKNRGPGSNTARRVKWPGIKHINQEVAQSFTPSKFIDGKAWIPRGIPYSP
ncbi:Pectinesterase [Bertholletia excelsa]